MEADTSITKDSSIKKKLEKYRYERSQKEYCIWEANDDLFECIATFRYSVLKEKWDDVQSILESLISEEDVGELLPLLVAHPSLETWKEALLFAITTGSRPLVEFVLSLFIDYPGEETKGPEHSCRFPPHMTPLMLACICNNFAIAECLLLRGHSLNLPHRADCCCNECLIMRSTVSTRLERFDTYKAICSDAFLWLGCCDPLLAVCLLNEEIEVGLLHEQEYKDCYLRLQSRIMTFSLCIVGQCWTIEEVKVLLMQKRGVSFGDCNNPFPRIRLALNTHMKYFLSNLTVQNAVKDLWNGHLEMPVKDSELPLQNNQSNSQNGYYCGFLKFMKIFDRPKTRYLWSFMSYLLFLLVLFGLRYPGRVNNEATRRTILNSYGRLVLEGYAYLYVFGMFFEHYLGLVSRGMVRFYAMWWRWFDIILFWLFFGSFYCHLMTIAAVHQDGLDYLHRKHWIFTDFSIVYDVYFGGACIMAFWRTFYFVQLNRSIGVKIVSCFQFIVYASTKLELFFILICKLQISVCRCVYHVITFLWIMGAVSLCFAIGINTLYESYTDNVAINSHGEKTHMRDTFATIGDTFRVLYWAFYGYLGPWDYNLVVGNSGPKQEEVHQHFTVLAGEVIVGIYHITVILGLINLMVSFLVRTADEVQENENIEWKYTRCHIYGDYVEWYSLVPPPLNIVYIIFVLVHRIRRYGTCCSFTDIFIRLHFTTVDEQEANRQNVEYEQVCTVPEPILAFMNKGEVVRKEEPASGV
uniref:TRP_2 domain-containing protein n=1 Tax=Syphacia muris TaxID=451379 RepID=A0A158R5N2_9BILA